MSAEKTEWIKLDVTMPLSIRQTIHECHRVLGTTASGWARDILLERLPELVRRAERRQREIQALFSPENCGGGGVAAKGAKRGDAAQARKRKQGQGRKAKG